MSRPQILSLQERLETDPSATGRGVCMAFVDLGFFAHPDLLHPTRRLRAYVDVTREDPAPRELVTPRRSSWHGTMTACTAAGSGYLSGGRYRGLAPGAEVVLIKVGSGESPRVIGKQVAAGIRMAVSHRSLGVRIINVSLSVEHGQAGYQDVLDATAEAAAAGMVVCAAAGNDPSVTEGAPAVSPHAITVGGVDDHNTRDAAGHRPTGFSRALQKPDLLAPANVLPAPMLPGTLVAREGSVLFELLGVLEEATTDQLMASELGALVPQLEVDSLRGILAAVERRISHRKYILPDYQHVDGTSFASPIVASVAAQMLEVAPTLAPVDLRHILVQTARRLPGLPEAMQGGGVVCPRDAVEFARRWAAG